MSGITGWVDWERDLHAEAETVRRMTERLAHRGPDGESIWISSRAAFSHRQLAIFNEQGNNQAGNQAGVLTSETPPVAVTFSGELYNRGELRAALGETPPPFGKSGDAGLVMHGYLAWGPDCVRRFAGVFAFAIWDGREQRLMLARDRLGIEPLYYAAHRGGLLFGSEPKALLANPLFEPSVDAEGLADIFTVAAKVPGTAVYRGLAEVRPGWTVLVTPDGQRQQRYWSLEPAPHTDDLAATTAVVHDLLADGIGGQLASDVPLGALLSGGLDSSVLAAFAARAAARNAAHTAARTAARTAAQTAAQTQTQVRASDGSLATFSLDFAGSDQDFRADALHVSRDAPYVELMTAHLRSRHTSVVLDPPDLLAEMGHTLRARDIPGVGDLDVSLYLLFREARKHAVVVLSGEGADDVFGGFPWFRAEAGKPTANFPWSAGMTNRNAMLSPHLRRALDLDERIAQRYRDALAEVPALPGEHGTDKRMREVSYLQLTRFLPFLLDRKDRMSMRAGLAVRVPFCDHRLVEYAWNIPWAMKTTGDQEKGILRAAAAPLLPPEVARRPKSGFPLVHAPEYMRAVRDAVRDMIADPGAPAMELINAAELTRLVDSDAWMSGDFTPPPWLPRALQLNTWLTEYRVRVCL